MWLKNYKGIDSKPTSSHLLGYTSRPLLVPAPDRRYFYSEKNNFLKSINISIYCYKFKNLLMEKCNLKLF